ncbi:hypothetical protein DIPPA_05332 [Diplonema papillatum]|nr:hypothetical protein DIPPA_05332 [Diplonema papillatum]
MVCLRTRRSRSANARVREADDACGVDVLIAQLKQHLEDAGLYDDPAGALREMQSWSAAMQQQIVAGEPGETDQSTTPDPVRCISDSDESNPALEPPLVRGSQGNSCLSSHYTNPISSASRAPVPFSTYVAPPFTAASPMAFMILTHHAIRVGMTKAIELLGEPATNPEGIQLLEETSRLIDLHTRQEDEVFFPYLRKCGRADLHVHSDKHHQQAVMRRQHLVQKMKGGYDKSLMEPLKQLVDDYIIHMAGEEQEIEPLMNELTEYNADSLAQAAKLLVKCDMNELLSHAVPFTTFQLCKTASYEDIKRYANILKASTTREAYVSVSRAMLMSAFEANRKFAVQLVVENVLANSSTDTGISHVPMSSSYSTPSPPPSAPKSRVEVACWLENDRAGMWSWKDVAIERNDTEIDALIRAERLHLKLAERFAETLRLKHVMIEEEPKKQEQTIYFFIDNHWEMARRALFAKLYTRMHKERGKRMHVVIIDAKERRTLVKREGGAVRDDHSNDSE